MAYVNWMLEECDFIGCWFVLCALQGQRLLIKHLQTGLSRILNAVFGAGFVDIAAQGQTAVV